MTTVIIIIAGAELIALQAMLIDSIIKYFKK